MMRHSLGVINRLCCVVEMRARRLSNDRVRLARLSMRRTSLSAFLIAGLLMRVTDTAAQSGHTRPAMPRMVWSTSQFVGLAGASISDDGRYVLFTDWTSGDLALHDLTTGANQRVTSKAATDFKEFAETFLRVSHDGKRFYYVWDKQPRGYELRRTDVPGSAPRTIYRPQQGALAVYALSADDTKAAATVTRRDTTQSARPIVDLVLIHTSDGSARVLKQIDARPQQAIFSPDGRFIAYEAEREILVIGAESGAHTASMSDSSGVHLLGWSPDGKAIVFASHRSGEMNPWLQPVDNGKTAGAPVMLPVRLPEAMMPLGITRDGTLYYATSNTTRHIHLSSADVITGKERAHADTLVAGEGADWSPDGDSLAYVRDMTTIVVRSLATGAERVVTTLPAIFSVGFGDRYVRWSPDGQQLLVPQRVVYTVNATTGEAKRAQLGLRTRYGRWSQDGRYIFHANLSGDTTSTQIVRRDLETGEETVLYRSPRELAHAHDDFHSLELSPDERWLAFSGSASTTEGDTRLQVVSADGGAAKVLLEVPDSEFLTVVGWTPDSREVLFTRELKFATERSRALWLIPVAGGKPRSVVLGANVLNAVRFHPDGKRFVFDSGERGATIWAIDGLTPR
ncbi:MAG TPA: hypothetical protein VMM17_02100 [Gemmatimonadaceae bacterium]|nr:hypothetical protein [Gemmatimonadaceae bacterium]